MANLLRLAVYQLAVVFALVSWSLGINAVVRSNHEKASLKAEVKPTILNIDTNDIQSAGSSATVAAGLAGIALSLFSIQLLTSHKPLTRRDSSIQAAVLAFFAIWLCASLVPFTFFFVTRSAKVTAFVGTIQVPASVVQQTQKALGATPIYAKKDYLKLFAIIPWISVLCTSIASIVAYTYQDEVLRTPPASAFPDHQAMAEGKRSEHSA